MLYLLILCSNRSKVLSTFETSRFDLVERLLVLRFKGFRVGLTSLLIRQLLLKVRDLDALQGHSMLECILLTFQVCEHFLSVDQFILKRAKLMLVVVPNILQLLL